MDQGLKERLIGAAVLVGLGVWLIPWVLDGSRPEEQGATELELPAQESLPMRTHTINLNEPRQTPATTAVAVTPERASRAEPEPAARPPAQTASARTPEDDAPAPTVAAAPAESAQTAAQAATASSGDAPGASDRPAEPAATVAKAEPEPPRTTAAPRPAPAAARPAASGEWMVQLGSFGEEENAKRLAERVRTFGYRPDISNVRTGGRLMYRVRVGPHATRGQAEAAASSLSAHGFVAQVVAAE